MWIARQLRANEMQPEPPAERGRVTIGGETAGVLVRGEERNLPVAAPGGYVWRPQSGESVLVLKGGTFGEERYIVGTVDASANNIADGEVRIYSAGGASITLRNNGRIELNGTLYLNGAKFPPDVI